MPNKNQLTFLDGLISRNKYPRTLGAPYQGSKSGIAKWIIDNLPPADNFVDLFGGGGAISHAAMLSGKYKNVINNDIEGSGQNLFRKGMNGDFLDYDRFVTRDDFFNGNATPEEKLIFSFGNDGRSYKYSKELEGVKKGIHDVIVPKDKELAMRACYDLQGKIPGFDASMCNDIVREMEGKGLSGRRLAFAKQMKRLGFNEKYFRPEHLENIERVNALYDIPNKGNFKFLKKSYDEVPIPENSVVYADPPYRNTKEYVANGFDFDAFDDWLRSRDYPVYVSEYSMPEDFKVLDTIKKRALMGTDKTKFAEEKLYTNGK